MTREEIEHLALFKPYSFMTEAEIWYNNGLLEGLRTADDNPKSPWISVNDDLPCNHEKLLLDNGLATKKVFVLINATTPDVIPMVKFAEWDWILDNVTHWFPIPELND